MSRFKQFSIAFSKNTLPNVLNVERSPPPNNPGHQASLTEDETIASSAGFGSGLRKRRLSFDYGGNHFGHEQLGKIHDPDVEITDSKKNMRKYQKYLGSLANGYSSDGEDLDKLIDGRTSVSKKDKYSAFLMIFA